jgi:polar amino acid transport system substrate-binding protein
LVGGVALTLAFLRYSVERSLGGRMKVQILAALGFVGLTALSLTTGAQNMVKYGDCTIYGTMGSMKFTPAIAGQLTVQTNLPSPGFWNGDSPELIKSGVEYCMAANLAHRAGLEKVVVQNVAWDGLVAGQTKDFDLAMSQISITAERKKVVEFSTPYFSSDIGVMVRKGFKVDEKSIKTAKVGVQQGTTGENFARTNLKIKNLKVFPDTPGMFVALQAKQVDIAMTDTSIVLSQAKQSAGKFEVVGQYKTGESYGALFPKANGNNKIIDAILKEMLKDGTVGKLVGQYLSKEWGVDPLKIKYFRP